MENYCKNSGNLQSSCDIIEDEKVYVLFGKYTLPVKKTTITALAYEIKSKERSCDEMALLAGQRLRENIAYALAGSELLSIKTNGAFTEDGYVMTAEVTVLKEIGEELKFERES